MKRETFLKEDLQGLMANIEDAELVNSWNAVAKFRAQARAVHLELGELRTAKRAANPRTLSPEEHLASRAEDAAKCEDEELEPYVREWMRRHKVDLSEFSEFMQSRLTVIEGGAG